MGDDATTAVGPDPQRGTAIGSVFFIFAYLGAVVLALAVVLVSEPILLLLTGRGYEARNS